MQDLLLEMSNIHKTYRVNNVVALKGAELRVQEGTVHSLVGENGAGKTTLMKILCGNEEKDKGKIIVDEEQVEISDPQEAFDHGIGLVHQHFKLIGSFTVLENILLGVEHTKSGLVDKQSARHDVEALTRESGLSVKLDKKVQDLDISERQKVEILRVLYRGARIIILDEPTSVLTKQETQDLFNTIEMLRERNKTLIFISHKLEEVKEIASEVTILREGQTVARGPCSKFSKEEMSYKMVGEKIDFDRDISLASPNNDEDPLLRIRNLTVKGEGGIEKLKGLNIDVKRAEITGIAGVAGNGQLQLAHGIAGLIPISEGEVRLGSVELTDLSPRERREAGLSYIPEDRISLGSSVDSSVTENILATRYHQDKFSNRGLINYDKAYTFAQKLVNDYEIKTSSLNERVGMLSGGNIQKVVLARELGGDPEALLVCNPTWGLDVQSTKFIYKSLIEKQKENTATLLISSNLDELFQLSTRILVIYEGEIKVSFDEVDKLTKAEVGEYMMGLHGEKAKET